MPQVGGTHGCVRRDGSDGWRSPDPRGDSTGRSRLSTPSANHRFQVPPTGSVHRDGSFFWDFGSLYFKALGRPSGQLLRQRQTQRKTLRRPCRRLLRQRPAQQVRRCGVKELKLVLTMEFLSSIASDEFCQSFIWQLALMLSRSCPCSLSRRLSCDRVTHRRAQTKLIELSPLVAVITWHWSPLWQSMMLQGIEAGSLDSWKITSPVCFRIQRSAWSVCVGLRRHGDFLLFPREGGFARCSTVDTSSCVSLRSLCCISRISP